VRPSSKGTGALDGVPTVSVLLPLAVDGPYTYRVPNGVTLSPGDIVRVPLGPREIIGAVWDDVPDGSVGHNRLRPVAHRYDAPPLDPTIRKFVDWVANYTLTPRGMVLRMVLRWRRSTTSRPSCSPASRRSG